MDNDIRADYQRKIDILRELSDKQAREIEDLTKEKRELRRKISKLKRLLNWIMSEIKAVIP